MAPVTTMVRVGALLDPRMIVEIAYVVAACHEAALAASRTNFPAAAARARRRAGDPSGASPTLRRS
jgi:hypothetical protein